MVYKGNIQPSLNGSEMIWFPAADRLIGAAFLQILTLSCWCGGEISHIWQKFVHSQKEITKNVPGPEVKVVWQKKILGESVIHYAPETLKMWS